MKHKLYCLFAFFVISSVFTGCKKDLSVSPNALLPTEEVFTDKNLITSVLGRFYQQVNAWGENNDDWNKFQQDPDDGINNNGGISTGNLTWGRDRYRVMDYGIIRRLNQFLEGIRSPESKKAMTAGDNANFEGQALVLRAYTYFWMVRTLGGMTIVGDQVFGYTPGMDVTPLQMPRNSEAECYQYIMDQCDSAAAKLNIPDGQNKNRAMANKWAAKMLKARAAITAASIAKYTPLRAPGNVVKDAKGVDVVGIPANKAQSFYEAALATAKDVIDNSPYRLMLDPANPEKAFYNATTVKDGNTEVIWSYDRLSPTVNIGYTRDVGPWVSPTVTTASQANSLGATLNLVEAFENRDGSDPKIKDVNPDGTYVFYNDVEEPFKAKDARLWGTVIWPNAIYRGSPVRLQAGYLSSTTLPYTYTTTAPSRSAPDAATGPNGPQDAATQYINKTGFAVRKWLDEKPLSEQSPNLSDVWWPRFRLSEAYLIAAEAAFELGRPEEGLPYINKLRVDRGRIQPLTLATFTFDKIVNEYRVEFAFEDHRIWDMKRWRLAHTTWNGIVGDPNAQPMALYAFKVNVAGDPNNGKWVFRRQFAWRRQTTPYRFLEDSYYSSIDLGWITPNNPNWVKNPYQN
jgi:hypothetical protein